MGHKLLLSVIVLSLFPGLPHGQSEPYYPTVAVVTEGFHLSDSQIQEIEEHVNHYRRHSEVHPAFVIDPNFVRSRDWDYLVEVGRSRGFDFGACGFNRTHYEWRLISPYGDLVDRGHRHSLRTLVKDVTEAVDDSWADDY